MNLRNGPAATALVAVVLSGCAAQVSTYQPTGDRLTTLLCAGEYEKAAKVAGADTRPSLVNARTRLLEAYALERAGFAMRARPLYHDLSNDGHLREVSLSCGGKILLDGTITDTARDRLRRLNGRLAALGATPRQVASLQPVISAPPAKQKVADTVPTTHAKKPVIKKPSNRLKSGNDTPMAAKSATPKARTKPERIAGWTEHRPTPPNARATRSGRYWIHLASYGSKDRALAGWRQLTRDHSKALKGCRIHMTRTAPIPGKGTFYRIGCRSFVSLDRGRSVCNRLRTTGQYCAALPIKTP